MKHWEEAIAKPSVADSLVETTRGTGDKVVK
jgi:hypothetical protein